MNTDRQVVPDIAVGLLATLLLSACATLPQPGMSSHLSENGLLGRCATFFADLDQQVTVAGVRDAGAFHVAGFPYLRTNRLLESFRSEAQDGPAFTTWLGRMQQLDQQARSFEIDNLPESVVSAEDGPLTRAALKQRVTRCGMALKTADFKRLESRNTLRNLRSAEDEYLLSRRILGLYPISRWFVSRGIAAWHRQARSHFTNLSPDDWQGAVYHYPDDVSLSMEQVLRLVSAAPKDALGIPLYSAATRLALLQRYAPVWQMETNAEFDRPGRIYWQSGTQPAIDSTHPVVYTRLSFTRFAGKVLTQLNYVIWFSSRPMINTWDIYAGVLDGLTFRITLDTHGQPLAYETMHNCGCYYRVFPGSRLVLRADFRDPEMPLLLNGVKFDKKKPRVALALSSRTHYVQHFYATTPTDTDASRIYELADYNRLLSLPDDTHRHSLFSEDGTVSASKRLERFVLWPTGVYSPGAMRQMGRHAIAFIGKRHFDDADLLQRMFRYAD